MDEPIEGIESTRGGQNNAVASELEYLRSIDKSLITIKRIARWFLILSIAGTLFGLLWIVTVANGGRFI